MTRPPDSCCRRLNSGRLDDWGSVRGVRRRYAGARRFVARAIGRLPCDARVDGGCERSTREKGDRMKAISLSAPRVVGIMDVAEPHVGPEDVLLQVYYVGLCGTDLHSYRGASTLITYPRIPGHEVSGTVVSKGERVPDSVAVGDRVMLSPYAHCGHCTACRTGRTNCCRYNETLGVQRDGAMTRRVAAHHSDLSSSDLLSFEELVLVEPMSVGYHATNRGRVTATDCVLVIGCGTIGIGVIAAASQKGARVIAVDIDVTKLDRARVFGAEQTINAASEDTLGAVNRITEGDGASVAIEAVGSPRTYRLAVDAVAYAGRVVYIGYTNEEAYFDTTAFVRKEVDIMGSRNALGVFPEVIRMMEQRQKPFEELITKTYPFGDAPQAFRDWDSEPGKVSKLLIGVLSSS